MLKVVPIPYVAGASKMKTAGKKFYSGLKVKIVGNNSGHDLPVGSIVTVSVVDGSQIHVKESGCWISSSDASPVVVSWDRETTEKEHSRVKEAKALVEEILVWMKDSETIDVSPREFKTYLIAKILSSESSPPNEKIVSITKLLKDNRVEEVFSMPFSVGSKVRVIGNKSRAGKVGSIFKIKAYDPGYDPAEGRWYVEEHSGIWFFKEDLTLATITFKDMNNKLHDLERELSVVQQKLDVLNKYNLQEGDAGTVAIGKLIESFNTISDSEKLKKVHELFNITF